VLLSKSAKLHRFHAIHQVQVPGRQMPVPGGQGAQAMNPTRRTREEAGSIAGLPAAVKAHSRLDPVNQQDSCQRSADFRRGRLWGGCTPSAPYWSSRRSSAAVCGGCSGSRVTGRRKRGAGRAFWFIYRHRPLGGSPGARCFQLQL